MEGNACRINGLFKIDRGEQFPHGLFAIAVNGQLDFEKSLAKVEAAQARDKESGERVWVLRVIDNDPEARQNEFKVKIIAPHCPALPEVVPGTNFRPVVFRNMTVTPYVEETKSGRARVAYSLRATGWRLRVSPASRPGSPRTMSRLVGDGGPRGAWGVAGAADQDSVAAVVRGAGLCGVRSGCWECPRWDRRRSRWSGRSAAGPTTLCALCERVTDGGGERAGPDRRDVRGDAGATSSSEVQVITPPPTLTSVLMVNLARLTVVLWRAAGKHPVTATGVVLVAMVWAWTGVIGAGCVLLVAVVALVVWARLGPESYRRGVVSRWRRVWPYGRWWQPAMVTCDLAREVNGREYLPRIRKVTAAACVDRVLVDLLSGQSTEDFERHILQLAHTFSVRRQFGT